MLDARQLIRLMQHVDAMSMLKALPDDHFKLALLASAELFKQMKDEAIRRGVWDEVKGTKVQAR